MRRQDGLVREIKPVYWRKKGHSINNFFFFRARLREYRQTADLDTLSVRALKALVRERNLNIRYPIERSELVAALTAPKEAGRWVFWEGVTKVR